MSLELRCGDDMHVVAVIWERYVISIASACVPWLRYVAFLTLKMGRGWAIVQSPPAIETMPGGSTLEMFQSAAADSLAPGVV